ncbi:MAG: hypothetical protein VYB45_03710 [Pseudomonadota bacterium]|nr:hypothetical protein [Pseudomonadota bacterium]
MPRSLDGAGQRFKCVIVRPIVIRFCRFCQCISVHCEFFVKLLKEQQFVALQQHQIDIANAASAGRYGSLAMGRVQIIALIGAFGSRWLTAYCEQLTYLADLYRRLTIRVKYPRRN